jgi:hypothetical protein
MKATSLTLIALLAASCAIAQPVRNLAERSSDHNQIQRDAATIERDRAELVQFQGYRNGMSQALASGNAASAQAHHAKLLGAMEREVAQGDAKINQAGREVVGSQSEVRSDSREVRGNRGQGTPVKAADDRQDRRDDRRDVSDDRSDLTEQRVRHARQNEILATFKGIQVQGNPNAIAALQAKAALLDEFEQTMVRDLGENREEIVEDKGELREDRRETREDRRQR